MKNKKLIKVLALVFALALMVVGAVAVYAGVETADEEEITLSIYKKNVSFEASPRLAFAVSYSGCEASDVKLHVWYDSISGAATEYVSNSTATIGGTEYPVFYLDSTNPKNIANTVYVQAVVGDVKSAVVRYSILEFAYDGIMSTDDAAEAARYQSIVTYAESIQYWLAQSNKYDGEMVNEYVYINAPGVDLGDGYSKGMYEAGKTISLNAEGVERWTATIYKNGQKTTQTYPNGASVTVNASMSFAPVKAPVYTFEDGAIPSDITVKNLQSGSSVNVKTTDDNNYLSFTAVSAANQQVTIPLMNDSTGNLTIFDANINIANTGSGYRMWFYDGTSPVFGIYMATYTSGNNNVLCLVQAKYGTTSDPYRIPLALPGEWFNLRLELYRDAYNETETVLNVYVDGGLAGVVNLAQSLNYASIGTCDSTKVPNKLVIYPYNTAGTWNLDNISFYNTDKDYEYKEVGIRNNLEAGSVNTLSTSNFTNYNGNGGVKVDEGGSTKEVTNAKGYTTGATVLESKVGSAGSVRLYNSAIKATKTFNNSVWEADLKLEINTDDSVAMLNIGSHANAYVNAVVLKFAKNADGKITVENGSELVDDEAKVLSISSGEWFAVRIEYYYVSADEILLMVYVNGALEYTTNVFYAINENGGNAFPCYHLTSAGESAYVTYSGASVGWGVNRATFAVDASSDVTITVDNLFVTNKTATVPTVESYDSYYAPAASEE